MMFATLNGITHHYRYRPGTGVPVVFLNSLGTDFRIWDKVIDRLPSQTPVLCLDKRGHGLSDDGPITMDQLIDDVAALALHLDLPPALICGVSVGGQIAQGFAAAHPAQVRALMLCCTGAKIGDAGSWNARIESVGKSGIAALSNAILERWFSPNFHATRSAEWAGYRNMLARTSAAGYSGVCAAIRDSDLTTRAGAITVPTVCIAGSEDRATPPELVRALAQIIPDASYRLVPGCGHLPCIENPKFVSDLLEDLMEKIS